VAPTPPGLPRLPLYCREPVVSHQSTVRNVLVVEDQPWVARAVRRALGQVGYRVELALSCTEARAACGPFDAGVFDLELPDGCGFSLARELLAECIIARVLFFTASTERSLLENVSHLGPVIPKREGLVALMRTLANLDVQSPSHKGGFL
jgi:DNA-binding NarL/FixJ family response regulator